MAEQTFADFIARDRERLHAEREQILNQQHELENKLVDIANSARLMLTKPPRSASLPLLFGKHAVLGRVRKLVEAASATP